VITLLADANITGHIARLMSRMRSEQWREFCDFLQLSCLDFQDLGLHPADTDAQVWHCCQLHEVLLLTNNRNDDGPDSLEATIRLHNTSQSVPVFTIADADKILSVHEYADRVIDTLLTYLFDIANLRGTGRLYLP
jgi:hypothetical protein